MLPCGAEPLEDESWQWEDQDEYVEDYFAHDRWAELEERRFAAELYATPTTGRE